MAPKYPRNLVPFPEAQKLVLAESMVCPVRGSSPSPFVQLDPVKVYFISGHLDITLDEFEEHYVDRIKGTSYD